jgi:hypothetical protein
MMAENDPQHAPALGQSSAPTPPSVEDTAHHRVSINRLQNHRNSTGQTSLHMYVWDYLTDACEFFVLASLTFQGVLCMA